MKKTVKEGSAGKMNDEQQTIILKALADEVRLRLLRLLSREELNVQEICDILHLPQPRVSRHLAALKKINLVGDRRDGTKSYYSTRPLDGPLKDFESYIQSVYISEHSDLNELEVILAKRTQVSHEFSSAIAQEWDNISTNLHSPLASMLTLASLAPRGLTVADLGCGTGIMLPLLSRFADKVYAVDHSEQMLEQARQRCEKLGIYNVEYIKSDLTNLCEAVPQCDSLLLHFVLHQVASPQNLLKELPPLLKDGGRLLIIDKQKHEDESVRNKFGSLWLGFEESQISSWVHNSGFSTSDWLEVEDDLFVTSATK